MFNVWIIGSSVVAIEMDLSNRAIVQIVHSQDRSRPRWLIERGRGWVGAHVKHAQAHPGCLNGSEDSVVVRHEGHDAAGRI